MKIWIFERVGQVSYQYHCDGGVVIIAKDEFCAKVSVGLHKDLAFTEAEWSAAKVFDLSSDATPEVIVFPDAGCC